MLELEPIGDVAVLWVLTWSRALSSTNYKHCDWSEALMACVLLALGFRVLSFRFTNDFLRQIEHQMTVFKGQLGTNLSTIPFHFKTHWDMKLPTRPTAAGTNTSPENCVRIYGDKYCLPPQSLTLHWILQMAPTEAENTMRMSAMVTSVKRITLREKGRDWLSSPPSIGSKLGSL